MLIDKAKNGKLSLEDLREDTFEIDILRMYSIDKFAAIINPSQVAILAVDSIKSKTVVVDGQIDVKPMMTISL